MNATRFVYSTDFVRLNRKLLARYNSADSQMFVQVYTVDGESLIKEASFDNLVDLWACYDEMYANLKMEDEYRAMAGVLLSICKDGSNHGVV